jgi:hypothetical protein
MFTRAQDKKMDCPSIVSSVREASPELPQISKKEQARKDKEWAKTEARQKKQSKERKEPRNGSRDGTLGRCVPS